MLSLPVLCYGATGDDLDQCLLKAIKSAAANSTIEQIRQKCQQELKKKITKPGAISQRILSERQTAFDPYVITPHKMNYILPVSISDEINKQAYTAIGGWAENFEDTEAKLQLSIKVPLNYASLFTPGDGIYFGFTLQSWWQVYSDNISKPFRETNYQPEFFYLTPLNWHPVDSNTGLALGIEHQSNGRSQLLSRSWNRLYVNFLFEKNNFGLSFKPWWRIEEDDKAFELDPEGDDNPDIEDFMGYFEVKAAYKWQQYELSFTGRENFAEHHGGLELGLTFPLWGKLRGYLQYTSGYGESLIDYNHKQQRFGLGIALTNLL
ncbi:phospholipase A [Thalassomonas actiniarum]|uniref:Phospholipase A1 n=2 Tax=Thalassomonas actiniarum TaxID=485447 RepID=A0AAF0C5U1_9GAMM|nr:phospholipase A [Thalassomonas actiniarum]